MGGTSTLVDGSVQLNRDMLSNPQFLETCFRDQYGNYLNRHGSEGDAVIGKAYIYDKYIDGAGRHCLKICGWGEDLEGNILEVVPMEAVLPSRANA